MIKKGNPKEQIMNIIFTNPNNEYHIRQISRMTKISPKTIAKNVKNLEEQGLITINKEVTHNIKANLENDKFKQMKRVHNLKNMYESGLFVYLKEQFSLATIILYGSYSLGEDAEKSDIDIAILDAKEIKLNLQNYEKQLSRPINIEFVNLDKATKELKSNILNGIVLQGHIEI